MSSIGPDSRQSWVVAVACFFVQVLTFGLADSSGILFVATIDKFGSSREETSLPFTLAYCVRSATGPLIGYLGHRYGMRQVTLIGAVLSSISVCACFFADDIVELTLLWGLVFGFSFGMETLLLNVILNEHFLKHRVKANGLNISGASLGTLLMSPLIENSVEKYGLSGTFLIIAGLMLNSIPACVVMLLNTPSEYVEPSEIKPHLPEDNFDVMKNDKKSFDYISEKPVIYSLAELNKCDKNIKIDSEDESFKKRRISGISEKGLSSSIILNVSQLKNDYNENNQFPHHWAMRIFPTPFAWRIKPYRVHKKVVSEEKVQFSPNGDIYKTKPIVNGELPKELCVNNNSPKIPNDSFIHIPLDNEPIHNNGLPKELLCVNSDSPKYHHESLALVPSESSSSSKWELYLLFCEPIYMVLVIGSAIYYFSITAFLTIIVDHSRDIGISMAYSTYILMWIGVSDLSGYFTLTWIIERYDISLTKFTAFSYLCVCLMSIGIVWSTHYIMLLVLITVFEFGQCGVYVLCAPVVTKLIDEDLQATAIASVTILSAPITMAIAPCIGYFRDGKGSYDGVFYVISAATFFCCVLFLFLPKLERRRNSQRSKT